MITTIFSVRAAMFLILIVSILVVIFMAAVAKGERLRTLRGLMISIGLMLFLGLVFSSVVVWLSFEQPTSQISNPLVSQLPIEGNVTEPVVTSEELWNRLTESRINLDDEQEDASPTEPRPNGRPDWVDKPPKRVGDVHRAVVASGPFSTVDECFEQLESRFPGEVLRRLTKLVPSDQRSLVGSDSLDAMGVTLDYIMREICREQYTQIVESSVGEMKQVHVLMEFTPVVESHLLDRWQTSQRRYRLTVVAQIAGSVLAALAILYGLLQIDTWTRGYYTQRLLWGVPAAIIAIAVVFVFLFGA